ncbi:MAG: alginate lyase family protein [Lachnospiraceae bacterium]|nr:alginate lyase family protein [Lachnospiraceae bacterium]
MRRPEQFQKYICSGIKYKEFYLWIDGLDNNPTVFERFLPDQLLNNKITLLNETRVFDKWNYEDATHLWNYNLHYLEYLVPLFSLWESTNNEKYKEKSNAILNDWYENGSIKADSNQPYTISLRIVNMLIISEAVTDKQKLYDSIYAQYRYLLKHQEKHLLGNHYLENLKAIVICSVVYGEESIYKTYIGKFFRELDEEITDDGLHFELSLMYHKIVLEDIIRVALVLKEAKKTEYQKVLGYIQKMATALYSLEYGMDRTPLFNDAGDNIAKPTSSLLKVCKQLGIEPEEKDNIAGYYKLYDEKIAIIVDCGELSPAYMPGHAHCDCLSFELFYNGKPIFVNSGTYQYQGNKRSYFRSTRAHNTVMINGHEQSELWGEHRAARRIKKVDCKADNKSITGEYINYLGEKHSRRIVFDNGLTVIDRTGGGGESFLHLATGIRCVEGLIRVDDLEIIIEPINAEMRIEESQYAANFGFTEDNVALVFQWENDKQEHGYKINFIKGDINND